MSRSETPSTTEGSDGIALWDGIPVRWTAWGVLLLVCVGSRLATAISYIEDPDSLRFALSVAEEYDVASLQPHFPGYPVFWALAEGATLVTGRFSAGFALVGGVATAGLVWALLRLCRVRLHSPHGVALAGITVFNPLVWLMGTRYMPDLLGAAGALACLVLLLEGLRVETDEGATVGGLRTRHALILGMAGTGLLAGLRLSALPLLLPPVLAALWWSSERGRLVLAGIGGVFVWLVPLVADTGVFALYDVAWTQTTGHFTEFGGTIQTESSVMRRLSGFVRGLWADGLGAWWPGRHPVTGIVGAGVLGLGAMGLRQLWDERGVGWGWGDWIAVSALVYAVWIFLFQNVVHKSRHVLPLIPLLLIPVAVGAVRLWQRGHWGRGAVGLFAAAYLVVTGVLVTQHRGPTAIAQAKRFLASESGATSIQVASVPLVNHYLRAQRVPAQYLSVEDSSAMRRLRHGGGVRRKTYVVGTYSSVLRTQPDTVHTFYHNPFVNRMWPRVTVYVYEP